MAITLRIVVLIFFILTILSFIFTGNSNTSHILSIVLIGLSLGYISKYGKREKK